MISPQPRGRERATSSGTYKHNGSPIPSFEGEPLRFACPRTLGDFAHGLWSSLNADNKVSLFARVIDLETGESGDMIFTNTTPCATTWTTPKSRSCCPKSWNCSKSLTPKKNKSTP